MRIMEMNQTKKGTEEETTLAKALETVAKLKTYA